MPKYMFVYRDTADAPQPSPEDMQKLFQAWEVWFKKFEQEILDGGDGLLPTGRVLNSDGVVSDGPYMEGKEMLGGYSVVQADSYERAIEIARECPIFLVGGGIEIREFAGYA